MKKVMIFSVFCLLAILLISGCKKQNTSSSTNSPPSSGSPGANEVWMQGNMFTPATITVPVNTTVKWTNKDGVDHNVTSGNGEFGSGTVHSGGTYSHQFTATGSYPYRCTIHAGMNGTVTVQ